MKLRTSFGLLASGLTATIGLALPAKLFATSMPQVSSSAKVLAPGKLDEVVKYKIDITISETAAAPARVIKISERMEQTVKEIKPGGGFSVMTTFTAGSVSFGANTQDILKMLPTVTVVRDMQGKFSAKATGGSKEGNPEVLGVLTQFAATHDTLLAGKVPAPGDSWKLSFSNTNLMVGPVKMVGSAKVAGTEEVDGTEVRRVVFELADSDMKPVGNGSLLLDKAGQIVQLTQKGRGIFAAGPATVELRVQRIK